MLVHRLGKGIGKREGERILKQLAGKIKSSWDQMSLNYGLHFTGGNHSSIFLLDLVKIADGLKIPSTFVETNSFWCGDDEVTREKL